MAIVTLPNALRFAREVAWTLDRPAQINRSGYTGQRSVIANPWHGVWSAKVELAPIIGEPNILAWRAFLGSLLGAVNSFRLPVTEGPQNRNSGVTVESDLNAGSGAFILAGLSEAMRPGQFITVNDQLMLCTNVGAFVAPGRQSVTVEPPLRVWTAAGTGVLCRRPTVLVSLKDSTVGWVVGPGQVYGASLDVEEVFSAAVTAPLELGEIPAPVRGAADSGAIVRGQGRAVLLANGSATGVATVLGKTGSYAPGVSVGSASGLATVAGVGAGGATSVARSSSTLTRTSGATTYPPTVDFNRPTDWADGDKSVMQWSTDYTFATGVSETPTPVSLSAATTSYDFGLSAITSGSVYIRQGTWDGTGPRPSALNWSNVVNVGDAVAPVFTGATVNVTENNTVLGSATANEPAYWTVGGTNGGQWEIINPAALTPTPQFRPIGNMTFDFEAQTQSVFDLTGTDPAGNSSTQTFIYNIANQTLSTFTWVDYGAASANTPVRAGAPITLTLSPTGGTAQMTITLVTGTLLEYNKNNAGWIAVAGASVTIPYGSGDTLLVGATTDGSGIAKVRTTSEGVSDDWDAGVAPVAFAAAPVSNAGIVLSGSPLRSAHPTDSAGPQTAFVNRSVAPNATVTLAFHLDALTSSGDGMFAGFAFAAMTNNVTAYTDANSFGVAFGQWGWEIRKGGAVQARDYGDPWAASDDIQFVMIAGSLQVQRVRGGTTTSKGPAITAPTGTGNITPFVSGFNNTFAATLSPGTLS